MDRPRSPLRDPMANVAAFDLQALLATTVDAVVTVDENGIVLSFDGAAERLFGYSPHEVIGHGIDMLMTEDDRARCGASLEPSLHSGVPHLIGTGREVTARRKDGSTLRGFLSVGPIAGYERPRFIAIVHDLTLRQQALDAVRHERDRANTYLEAMQTILVGLDSAHRITVINRKGCEMLGYAEADLLGRHWFSTVVPTELIASLTPELDALMGRCDHQPHYYEHPVVTRTGARRLMAWRCKRLQADPQDQTRLLCSGEDVTDARRADAELRQSEERMTHVSRLATMGEMASSIAHDINQPLAAITNYAQASVRLLAVNPPDLDEVREALQQIAEQALRAGDIIRRLRSLVRNRQTAFELGAINTIVAEVEPLLRADARGSNVKLSFELGDDLPNINLDRIQMQQVVLILVRNAIDALNDVPADRRSVLVRTTAVPNAVQVVVQDDGPGVAPDILGRLFMPFVTTKDNGTGLGLAIARTIVEAHRGRLDYHANQPRGACFVVALPAGPMIPS